MRDCTPCAFVGFPRVSGDEPSEALRVYTSGVFSPRERG